MKAGMHKAAAFKSVANGLSRALISKLQGGDYRRAFWMSVGSSALRVLYVKVVSYEVTWKSGGDAIEKGELTPPKEGANNFANASDNALDKRGFWEEGGSLSTVANKIPGMNAVAGMHDIFQNTWTTFGGSTLRTIMNVPGMLPAAAIAYGALSSDYIYVIDQSERHRRRR